MVKQCEAVDLVNTMVLDFQRNPPGWPEQRLTKLSSANSSGKVVLYIFFLPRCCLILIGKFIVCALGVSMALERLT